MKVKFAENLKMLRNEAGLSQQQLADKLKTSQRKISYLESGLNEPNLQDLFELSEIFDVSIDFLVGKTDY